jgi:hypothetical protein
MNQNERGPPHGRPPMLPKAHRQSCMDQRRFGRRILA